MLNKNLQHPAFGRPSMVLLTNSTSIPAVHDAHASVCLQNVPLLWGSNTTDLYFAITLAKGVRGWSSERDRRVYFSANQQQF